MNQQQALELNWQHFVVEGKPKCIGVDDNFMYHDPGTLNCCSVGRLMSPELREYLSGRLCPVDELESLLEDEYPELLPGWRQIVQGCSLPFLEHLQGIHDCVVLTDGSFPQMLAALGTPQEQFRNRLTALAKDYNLKIPDEQANRPQP